jgi:hypothetical protein
LETQIITYSETNFPFSHHLPLYLNAHSQGLEKIIVAQYDKFDLLQKTALLICFACPY